MQQLIGLAFLRNNTNILCNGFVVFVSYLHLYVYMKLLLWWEQHHTMQWE